jgi:hypothetical protein
MVLVYLDTFDELVDQDLAFGLCRGLPDRLDVEVGEVGGDLLEPFSDVDRSCFRDDLCVLLSA